MTVEFEVSDELICHRCDGPLLLAARVPHTLTRVDGAHLEGTRGIGLCPNCDSDDPDAQGVLAFFVLHRKVSDDTVTSAAVLIDEWAQRIQDRPRPDMKEMRDAAEDEHRRWLDGDL